MGWYLKVKETFSISVIIVLFAMHLYVEIHRWISRSITSKSKFYDNLYIHILTLKAVHTDICVNYVWNFTKNIFFQYVLSDESILRKIFGFPHINSRRGEKSKFKYILKESKTLLRLRYKILSQLFPTKADNR